MTTKKFKVGDRVEILYSMYYDAKKGDILVITAVGDNVCRVKSKDNYKDDYGLWFAKSDLKLVDTPDCYHTTTLPTNSTERKDFPLFEGLVKYFPKALADVAHISKIGNDKHNPGEPLHHSRGKSGDHADCIVRHLIDLNEDHGQGVGRDENGVPQVAYIAWRALALAQEWLEKHEGAPLAPGAKGESDDNTVA